MVGLMRALTVDELRVLSASRFEPLHWGGDTLASIVGTGFEVPVSSRLVADLVELGMLVQHTELGAGVWQVSPSGARVLAAHREVLAAAAREADERWRRAQHEAVRRIRGTG